MLQQHDSSGEQMEEWYDLAKSNAIERFAVQIGMEKNSFRWGPCPACNSGRASNKDDRPPVAFTAYPSTLQYKNRWYCNACETKGNVFDLVAFHLDGKPASELKSWSGLRKFFTGGHHFDEKSMEKFEVKKKGYPPIEEVKHIIKSATPLHLSKDKSVLAWCERRGLNPKRLMHGPRVLDMSFDFEGLTKVEFNDQERSWFPSTWAKKYPVIVPMVDWKGDVRSFVARPIFKSIKHPKSRRPLGFSAKNLYFVNVASWKFLTQKILPKDMIIAEGEIDFLSVSQNDVPVIGITNGSIDHLQMMPWKAGQTVHIATDNDKAGNKLAKQIPNMIYPAQARRCHISTLGAKK